MSHQWLVLCVLVWCLCCSRGWTLSTDDVPKMASGIMFSQENNSFAGWQEVENSAMNRAAKEIFTLTQDSIKPDDPQELTPQLRLEKLQTALSHLPSAELETLGVDLSKHIEVDTPEAELLWQAWEKRQIEVKQAMESLLDAAKHMSKLIQKLNSTEEPRHLTMVSNHNETIKLLLELEDLVDDVDNSRDFKTLGGWPVLIRYLHPNSYPNEVQTVAAKVIGTAVKGDYDYQLWLLDPISVRFLRRSIEVEIDPTVEVGEFVIQEDETTALEILLESLSSLSLTENTLTTSQEELLRRILYAISSSVRGNLDIQNAVSIYDQRSLLFESSLIRLVSKRHSYSIYRRVWSLIADLLAERRYIHTDFLNELQDSDIEQVKEALQQITLLGDRFRLPIWRKLAIESVNLIIDRMHSEKVVDSESRSAIQALLSYFQLIGDDDIDAVEGVNPKDLRREVKSSIEKLGDDLLSSSSWEGITLYLQEFN